jgi:hypothetical protein
MFSGFNHFGISVNNLEAWIGFFCEVFDLKLIQSRTISDQYVSDLVLKEGASAKIALLQTRDGDLIELVEWNNPQEHDKDFEENHYDDMTSIGNTHLCLNVEEIDAVVDRAKKNKLVKLRSKGVVTVTSGPNQGARVVFLEIGSNVYLELFEHSPSLKNSYFKLG